ncbi:hypothetical protein T440DRAFT_523520 [Plenodomus tracheiphilus IPT5]|uniref:Uncharacterized protein n=1 Tax=Plenodomus tracheiphilus IPT5 TaxID=1408161 RepID=A0A6A7AQF9_9PLEO|nr:hypothetical protein T440DRAFT_523520 [Plenodomus tracheiphilus IPT5]
MPAARHPRNRWGVDPSTPRRTPPVVDLTQDSPEPSKLPHNLIPMLAARQGSGYQGQHSESPTYSDSHGPLQRSENQEPPQRVIVLLEQALLLARARESHNTAVQRDIGALEREHIELEESYDRFKQVHSKDKTRWAMQETMFQEALNRQELQIGMLEARAHIGEEWRVQLLQRDKTIERLRKSIASRILSIGSNYCNGCGNDIDTSNLATSEFLGAVNAIEPNQDHAHITPLIPRKRAAGFFPSRAKSVKNLIICTI